MRMSEPFKQLCSYPVGEIAALLPAADDPVWDRFAKRQREYPVHQRTRSIGFIWSDGWVKGKPLSLPLGYAPKPLTAAVMACGEAILAYYPGGSISRLMLTDLPAGTAIPRHRDAYALLEETHRCHLPIVTSPDVTFMLDDVGYHFPAGEIYEIDNMRPHAVTNAGSERRVHLICNIMPPQPKSQILA